MTRRIPIMAKRNKNNNIKEIKREGRSYFVKKKKRNRIKVYRMRRDGGLIPPSFFDYRSLPGADAADNLTRYRNSRRPRPRARCRRICSPSCRLRGTGRPYPARLHPPRRRTCRPNPATSCCISSPAAPATAGR
ncbi:hypothetical protein PUN28_019962 [Cardiocondyla obscurior]|uniref:Uncharacterized protein n=1 Tax=Cardiocondyla obscurior TaxID=286306 RepID=A0AAW2E9H8_9HYME